MSTILRGPDLAHLEGATLKAFLCLIQHTYSSMQVEAFCWMFHTDSIWQQVKAINAPWTVTGNVHVVPLSMALTKEQSISECRSEQHTLWRTHCIVPLTDPHVRGVQTDTLEAYLHISFIVDAWLYFLFIKLLVFVYNSVFYNWSYRYLTTL